MTGSPNNTSYYFFDGQYKTPIVVFQQGKVVIDRELIQSQVGPVVSQWQQNVATFGEQCVSRSCIPVVNSFNLQIPVCRLIAEDGLLVDIDEPQTISAAALGAGTYYVTATVQCDVKDSSDDSDMLETAYGADTIMMMELKTTFSLQAAVKTSRIVDTSLSSGGTEGAGGAIRHLVVSSSLYASNRFKWGNVKDSNGTRYKIIEQRDNTPGVGQTTFVCDKGPNQSAPTLTGGVGGYLIYPYPFYQPLSAYAVRYIVLGTVTVNGSFQITGYTHTAPYFDTNAEMLDLFGVEHSIVTGLFNGPSVVINNTGTASALTITHTNANDAVSVTNSGGAGIKITNNSTTNHALNISQSTNIAAVRIDKVHTGNQGGVLVNNSGSGPGVKVNQTGAGYAIEAASNNAATSLYVHQDNTSATTMAQHIYNQGSGEGLVVSQAGNGYGLRVYQSGSADALRLEKSNTGAGSGIMIFNSGSGTGIYLEQRGNANGIFVNQTSASTAVALRVDNQGTGNALALVQNGEAVALVVDKSAIGSAQCLLLRNSGTGATIKITSAGASNDIEGTAAWQVDKAGNATLASLNACVEAGYTAGVLALSTTWQDAVTVSVTVPTGCSVVLETGGVFGGAGGGTDYIKIVRDSSDVVGQETMSDVHFFRGAIDTPAAGTYSYKLQAKDEFGIANTLSGRFIKATVIK